MDEFTRCGEHIAHFAKCDKNIAVSLLNQLQFFVEEQLLPQCEHLDPQDSGRRQKCHYELQVCSGV